MSAEFPGSLVVRGIRATGRFRVRRGSSVEDGGNDDLLACQGEPGPTVVGPVPGSTGSRGRPLHPVGVT